ncbi:MAG: hypothetical protein ACI3YQ_09505, partial [Prevotella sp.]
MAGQGTGQCPTHFSQATSETRLFRRTQTCPLYRSILDAPDFLYKVLNEEPFVKKKILGDISILHGSAKHLYRYGRLLL